MESKDEWKKKLILKIVRYYFYDTMRVVDIDFDFLLDERSYKRYENVLMYHISKKIFIGAKPLRIWFKEIDAFIKIYHWIRYLVLFASKRYNAIYDRVNYLISETSGIT